MFQVANRCIRNQQDWRCARQVGATTKNGLIKSIARNDICIDQHSVCRERDREREGKSCFELHWMFEQTFHSKRPSKSGRARRTKPCIGVANCIDFAHTLRWMAAEINADETKVKRNESLEKCPHKYVSHVHAIGTHKHTRTHSHRKQENTKENDGTGKAY